LAPFTEVSPLGGHHYHFVAGANAVKTLRLAALLLFALCLAGPRAARADTDDSGLPPAVLAQVHLPLKLVGEGNYRKFGFKIYHASLWAPDGIWSPDKPYVLKVQYARGLSKNTLVDGVMDDIHEENVADDATLDRWHNALNMYMPAVEEDDTIIGASVPGRAAVFFYNGKKLAGIEDKAFGEAFFNIWLGNTADEDLHKKLLGQADE
jgi:hypothetical protein